MSEEPIAFSIKVEPGDQDDPIAKFKDALTTMRKTMALQLEFQKIQAKILRSKYEAYVAEGFTKDQALFLCKDMK